MKFSSVVAPALVANVVVWWIYLAQDDRGFPWPIFVTIASAGGLVATIRRDAPAAAGRQRNRNRTARRSGPE